MDQEKIWDIENRHLQTVYGELLEENKEAEKVLHRHHKEGMAHVQQIDKDLSLDLSNIGDQLDSFAQIEIRNREIDQLNAKHDTWSRKYETTNALLKNPYFARIDVHYNGEDVAEKYYLGLHSFVNKKEVYRVIDWRSPVAELYYNQEIGETSYTVEGNEIPVNLELRRQFTIQKNKLIHLFDSSVAIEDQLLLSALENNSSQYMQDITATIQKEQNAIIRDTKSQALLVNGIAGSGKTSAVLQRIAYLLYQERSTLKSEDVVLLAPNALFMNYISKVLPNLGEKNPTNETLSTLLRKNLPNGYHLENELATDKRKMQQEELEQEKVLRSAPFFEHLVEQAEKGVFSKEFFTEVKRGEKTIFSKEKIQEWFLETPETAPIRARMQGLALHAKGHLEESIRKKSRSKKMHDKISQFTESQQEKYFGGIIEDESVKNITRLAEKFLRRYYQSIFRQIKRMAFLDLKETLQQFYKEYTGKHLSIRSENLTQEEALAILHLNHLYAMSMEERQVKYVLVDEAQDYSPYALLLVLTKFPRAKFTLLGDENQAIFQTHTSFATMAVFFEKKGKTVTQKHLLTSYRSNAPITRLFKTLANQKDRLKIVEIREGGSQPEKIIVPTQKELLENLKKVVQRFDLEKESVAFILKDFHEAEKFRAILAPLFQVNYFDIHTKKVPGKGINLLSIPLAKGLEFDHVVILDASEEQYNRQRDRYLLYTAISRGMKSVTLVARGELSSLLK